MNVKKVSTTKLKRNISDVLHTVSFEKQPVIIERYDKPIAKIYPIDKKPESNKTTGETEAQIAPQLKELAQEQVEQGYYSSLKEVINDALRKLLIE